MAWQSCFVLLSRTGGAAARSPVSGGRWRVSLQQQRCGFRKATRKPEPRRAEEELSPPHAESSEAAAPRRTPGPPADLQARPGPTRDFRRLLKPLVFTVGFTGCSFGSAAIWQYETLKSRVQSYFDRVRDDWLSKRRHEKQGDFREQMNQLWNIWSEGQRVVAWIIAANVAVFCCWRVPVLQRTMVRYFTASPASKALCSPMLLSTFSHFSLWHLAANMFVLWSLSTPAVTFLGREQFMAVYLSGGVISTFASYVWKTASGRLGPSLGASGAIMTILASLCTQMPEAHLRIIFLPMFVFTAGNTLKALVAVDTLGVVLGWRFFDHAAHLGGALFGIWYILFGHELVWKNREPFVKVWHNLRTRQGSPP